MLGFITSDPVAYIFLFLEAVTGRRQMTVKLPNGGFTLSLEVANLSRVIRKRGSGRACTLRCHHGHHGALRSGGQAFLRASSVMSFWQ